MSSRSKRPSAHQRSAITLIEVMGTLSVLLALGLAAASILQGVTEIGQARNQSNQVRSSVRRLVNQLRTDVKNASEITVVDEALPITIRTPESEIRYTFDTGSHEMRRVVFRSEPGQSTLASAAESFSLPHSREPTVSVDDDFVTVDLLGQDAATPWMIEVKR
ncbi:hypothetical protein [Novipirellula artificiosorum]|uniref:Prepilin-type N-terminal cleavage/methylation domain-containing protein n=1 Tax=Novipirellula artificiosorum TaxID=2528016 RepID=A0A5C6DCA8_9BACT|nr:hypothetical protein [Novipirellula artificiosorum]TWU32569.1 hypothetical protein Poly41_55470 [Novipirellula artificiosorum]